MLKVKLEHSHGSIDRVYKILIDNNILILNSKEFGGVTTTCLVEDRAALQNILKLLNERIYGVSLLSAKPTLSTLLRSIFK